MTGLERSANNQSTISESPADSRSSDHQQGGRISRKSTRVDHHSNDPNGDYQINTVMDGSATRVSQRNATPSFHESFVEMPLNSEDEDEDYDRHSEEEYNQDDPGRNSQDEYSDHGYDDDDEEYGFYASTKHILHFYRVLKAIQPAAKVYEGGIENKRRKSRARGFTQSTQQRRGATQSGFPENDSSDEDLNDDDEMVARMLEKDVPVTVMIEEKGIAFSIGRIHTGVGRVYLERDLFSTYKKTEEDVIYTFALPLNRLLQCLKILSSSEIVAKVDDTSGDYNYNRQNEDDNDYNGDYGNNDGVDDERRNRRRKKRDSDEHFVSNICRIKYKASGDETFVLVFEDGRSLSIKCEFPVLTVDPYTDALPVSDVDDLLSSNSEGENSDSDTSVREVSQEQKERVEENEQAAEKDAVFVLSNPRRRDEDSDLLSNPRISDSEEDASNGDEYEEDDDDELEEDPELFYAREKLEPEDEEAHQRQREKTQKKIHKLRKKQMLRKQRALEHQTDRVMGLDINNLRFKVLFKGKILSQKLQEMIVLKTQKLQIRASSEAPRLSFVSKADMSDSAQYFPEMDAFPSIERFFIWSQKKSSQNAKPSTPSISSSRRRYHEAEDENEEEDEDEEIDEEDEEEEDVATFWYEFRQITMAIEGISIGETQNIRCDRNGFLGIQSKYVVDREQKLNIFFDFRFSALQDEGELLG